ncbi:MAG TPA: polysaccharide biosynthesis C-terminal domain-containing protein [Actinopolymorphaceae bacterium]
MVAILAQFAAGVLAARLLRPEALGVASVGLSVGWAVAIVANAGLNISAIYHLGRRPDDRTRLVQALIPLAGAALTLAMLVAIGLAPIVGRTALHAEGAGAIPWSLFVCAGLLAIATIAYEIAGAILLGIGDRRSFVLGDVVRSVAILLAVAVLLVGPARTATGYVAATALGVVGPAVYLIRRVRSHTGTLRPRWDAGFARDAIRTGLTGQLGNILTFVNLRLDALLVPVFVSLDSAGVYFVATRVSEVVAQLSTAAAAILFPHIAASTDRTSTVTTERAGRLTLTATLSAGAVLAAVSAPLLGLVFGASYRRGTWALVLLLVAMLPLGLGRILSADLKGRGRVGVVSIAAGVGAAVTVVADVALLPRWGIAGAAVASILAYGTTAGVLVVAFCRSTGAGPLTLCPRVVDVVDLFLVVRRQLPSRGSAGA